jgi:hypothetical protein
VVREAGVSGTESKGIRTPAGSEGKQEEEEMIVQCRSKYAKHCILSLLKSGRKKDAEYIESKINKETERLNLFLEVEKEKTLERMRNIAKKHTESIQPKTVPLQEEIEKLQDIIKETKSHIKSYELQIEKIKKDTQSIVDSEAKEEVLKLEQLYEISAKNARDKIDEEIKKWCEQ